MYLESEDKVGGPGKGVQIDERKFGKGNTIEVVEWKGSGCSAVSKKAVAKALCLPLKKGVKELCCESLKRLLRRARQ